MLNNEKKLLNQVKRSDGEAFKELYNEYHPRVFKYIYYKSQNYDLALDIAQDTFVKVWKNRETLKPDLSFFSYILKISNNLLKDYYKHESVKKKHEDNVAVHSESIVYEPERMTEFGMIHRKIIEVSGKHLPAKCREIFILSRVNGLSNQEIADQLAIKKKTVENQLFHALKVLREKIKYVLILVGVFPF